MWEAFKNIVASVQDATGIEIPALPVDVESIGAAAGEAVANGAAQVTEAVSGLSAAGEAAAQAVPDVVDLAGQR